MNVLIVLVVLILGSYVLQYFRSINAVNYRANRSFFNINNFWSSRRRSAIVSERNYHISKINLNLIPKIIITIIVVYFLFKML